MVFECDIGSMTIEIEGQAIEIPVRTELLLSHLMGELSDQELLQKALEEAPQWLEVKEGE